VDSRLTRELDAYPRRPPASVRRLLTASGNPELRTVVAMADALEADVVLVPRKQTRPRKPPAAGS
jgi:hypothetical protein